jgi:hypothetical protein
MTVIVAVIVGFLTGRMLWLAMRKSWHRQPLLRTNYRGVSLPTAAGVVLSLSLMTIEAGRQIMGALGAGDSPGLSGPRAGALIAVTAFTILGLLDDLIGTSGTRGFGGHVKALSQGELTSGMLKAVGGAVAALVAAGLILSGNGGHGFVALVLDAAIIALAANLFNLFDLRPGRSGKLGLAVFVLLAVLSKFAIALVPVAIVMGAVASIILDDLHERLMLGDTGANAMGAAIGFGLATQVSAGGRLIATVALLALNLLSEVVSFTKIIDNFGPFKALDEIGRKRPAHTVDVREPTDPFSGGGSAGSRPYHDSGSTPPFTSERRDYPFPSPSSTDLQTDHEFDELFNLNQGNIGGAPETDIRESLFGDEPEGSNFGHDVDDDAHTNRSPRRSGHRSDRI